MTHATYCKEVNDAFARARRKSQERAADPAFTPTSDEYPSNFYPEIQHTGDEVYDVQVPLCTCSSVSIPAKAELKFFYKFTFLLFASAFLINIFQEANEGNENANVKHKL